MVFHQNIVWFTIGATVKSILSDAINKNPQFLSNHDETRKKLPIAGLGQSFILFIIYQNIFGKLDTKKPKSIHTLNPKFEL